MNAVRRLGVRGSVGRCVALAPVLAVVVLMLSALSAGPAAAGSRNPAEAARSSGPEPSGNPVTAATTTQPGVLLLSQTPWVNGHGVFHLHLLVGADNPSSDTLDVRVFLRLRTRTDFDNALTGKYNSYSWYNRYLTVSDLPRDPSGTGVDVDIPVNQQSNGSQQPSFDAEAQSAVFPMEISVRDPDGNIEGQPFTTFLVWAAGSTSVTALPPLLVSVMVPFSSPPVITPKSSLNPPTTPEARRLNSLAGVIAKHPTVPVNLEVVPQTLDALVSGGPIDQSSLADLSTAVAHGSETLPSTYSGEPVGNLVGAGIPDEADRQLTAGSVATATLLGGQVERTLWAIGGQVGPGNLSALLDRGMTGLIIPDTDLSPLPPSATETTFARSTGLSFGGAQGLTVMAADPGITADFARSEPPVLAANQLLAELAMIQIETPGLQRGVVAAPPAGLTTSPEFYSTLLAGLAGHPLLSAVTATNLLANVPHSGLVRQLVGGDPDAGPVGVLANDAGQMGDARNQLSGLVSITPDAADQVANLEKRLFVAESTTVTEAQRQGLLNSIQAASLAVTSQIRLPRASSITLTSTKSSIPVTILSARGLHAHVRVTLASQRLIFQPFNPPEGPCRVLTSTSEVCQLTLVNENTTLKVPVQTRASGIFPLTVSLLSADGSLPLATDEDTVRSTAISGVGIVLIALTLVSLAVWWIRDLRRGRRPRSLVPAPVDEAAQDPTPQPVSPQGAPDQ